MDEDGSPDSVHSAKKRKWSPLGHAPHRERIIPLSSQGIQGNNHMDSQASMDELEPMIKRARHLNPSLAFTLSAEEEAVKSHRQCPMSSLPPEILQHIFSFLEPVSLGRLLSVGKTFNALLDPRRPPPVGSGSMGRLSIQNQESIWVASRKLHHLGFPRPIGGMSESETWRLIRGRGCQFCGKRSASRIPPGQPLPWNAGPGPDGVRIIWPFHVRTCGKCLEVRLVKETELLFSMFSSLMPAMPFAFFTPSLNYVASVTLRHSSTPAGLTLTKYFFRPQVDEVKLKLEEVRSLGQAAAEEWHKGLESAGQEKANDAARFEQWEATGGHRAILTASSTATTPPEGTPDPTVAGKSTPHSTQPPSFNPRTSRSPLTGNVPPMVTSLPTPAPGTLPNFPLKPMTPAPGQYPSNDNRTFNAVSMTPHVPQPKTDRNVRDVNQMKAERRAEIERRCLELDPPIKASTLVYMDAFTASLQIPMALNENAWQLLKTRLLSQRKVAEAKEEERRAENVHAQATLDERRSQEEQLKTAKDNLTRVDRDVDDPQKPVRERLGKCADDFIKSRWGGGELVRRENAAQFAAEVLIDARNRFYEGPYHEDAFQNYHRPPSRLDLAMESSSRGLKLEDMKWVFETKIKPVTEQFGRELFLCRGCEYSNKYYAFDAVVQHFAAKHTNALSHGNATVYWKSEWPDELPFDPSSGTRQLFRPTEYFANGTSPMYSHHGFTSHTQYERPNLNTDDPLPPLSERAWTHQAFSPSLPGPRVPQPVPPGPLPPQKSLPQATNGAFHGQYSVNAQQSGFAPSFGMPNNGRTPRQHEGTPLLAPAAMPVLREDVRRLQETIQRPPSLAANTSQLRYPRPAVSALEGPTQPSSRQGYSPVVHSRPSLGFHQIQIEFLSVHAREIWDGTDGIEGLPDNVRAQVIILQVTRRFSEKYDIEPNLMLFLDALNDDPRMEPIRSLRDLRCKTCSRADNTLVARKGDLGTPSERGGVYILSALLAHFQATHIEVELPTRAAPNIVEMMRLDWKVDMIELPERAAVADLMKSTGMTDAKLSIIAMVLPECFPTPLPKVDDISAEEKSTPSGMNGGIDSQHIPQTQPALVGLPNTEMAQHINSAAQPQHLSQFTSASLLNRRPIFDTSAEEGYDPHRPAPPLRFDIGGRFQPQRGEPAFARRVVYHDTPINQYMEERPYEIGRRQPHVVYRYGDNLIRERLPRYEQDYYVPERVGRVPIGRDSRDRTYRSERLQDPVEVYPTRRSINYVDEPESAPPATQRLKRETDAEMSNDSAEQFLNNFDSIADESYPADDAIVSSHNVVNTDRLGDRRTTSRLADGAGIEHNPAEIGHPQTRIESLEATPMELIRSHDGRERSKSPLRTFPRRQDQDDNFANDAAANSPFEQKPQPSFRHRDRELEDQDENPPPRGRATVIEYDQNGLPLTVPHLGPRRTADVGYYERSPPRYYQTRQALAPPSPEFYRPHPVESARYSTRPIGQTRFVDDDGYYESGFEPVEYVRVAPRQSQLGSGYLVERPREPPLEYVENDNQGRRDQIYERDGHLYRTIPSSERRYNAYELPSRYQ